MREVVAIWLMWAVIAAAVWVTYARLPAIDFYNVSGTGLGAGAARVLVLLGWPIAIAAVGLLGITTDRLLALQASSRERQIVVASALVSLGLCATIAWPGVITQSNLDAKPSNILAATGDGIAVALAITAVARGGLGQRIPLVRGDRVSLVVIGLIAIAATPWTLANLGIYAGDIPGLSHIFMSKQILPEPGHPHLHAVHLGNHEGLDGWLLAATALTLRRTLPTMRPTRLRTTLALYLALMLCYGLMVAANDGWNEQIVKRGWTGYGLPSVITPTFSGGWAFLLALTALAYLTIFRIKPGPTTTAAE